MCVPFPFVSRLLLLTGLLAGPAFAADANQPHDHQGKLKAFTVPPAVVDLAPEEKAILARDEPVQKQIRGDKGGRGIAILDVRAEPALVWSAITDMEQYPKMVENVKEASIYERTGDHIKARFLLGGPGVNVEYFVDHRYRPADGYMTWTLDYSKKSDLDDSVGYWLVSPHPDRPGWSRIQYSIEIRVGWWLPGFVENMLARDGLAKSTLWAKREAERRAAARR